MLKNEHTPDLRAARAHLRLLTGQDDPIVSWQVFCDSDKERRDLARSFHGRLDDVLPRLDRAQAEGCGVFVAVNETDGEGRRKENITRARAVFLDLDGTAPPDSWPEPPHLLVRSSNLQVPKFQAWWRIPDTDDFEAWTAFQRLLADRYGGDPKCTMLTQVGRCAGFWHLKDPDRPQRVTIIDEAGRDSAHTTTWPLDVLALQFDFDLAAALSERATDRIDPDAEPASGWDHPADLARARSFLADPDSWHGTSNGEVSLYRAASSLRDLGISPEMAEELISELLPIDVPASWSDDHIARKVRNAYQYAAEPPGAASTPEPFDDDLDVEREPHRLSGLSWRRASEVEQKNIDWLWPNRIALGKLTGIAGPPDQGKSQVTATIAAVVTTGGVWPDGGHASAGSVIMLSAEDDAADTTVPRLEAAGADLDRVLLLDMTVQLQGKQRMFNFADDLPRLERMLAANRDVKLLVVDPISAYLGTGAVNTFKNSEVRGVLAPLGDLAARYGVAVLFVTHFNKSGTGSVINRVMDSGAFTALSRSFWAVMPEQDEGAPTGRKLLVSIKNNIARVKKGMAYSFEDVTLPNGVRTSHVVWGGEVDVTADEVLTGGDQELKSSPKLSKAVTFLLEALKAGPVPSADIDARAKRAGHADMTMRRARQYLKVEPYQQDGKWWCDLDNGKDPDDEAAE